MSEAIPARAFYEAYGTAMLYPVAPWDDLADDYRTALEVGVQAAIAAARVPSVAINLNFDGEVTEERAEEIRKALAAAIEPGQFRDRLAAAMAARDEYRDNAILHIRERDEARAQLAAVTTERDQLRKGGQKLDDIITSQAREMYAALIDVRHGDASDADVILAEALDGFEPGDDWNGTETGVEWLERTRAEGS